MSTSSHSGSLPGSWPSSSGTLKNSTLVLDCSQPSRATAC
jgi:hypothetical protein